MAPLTAVVVPFFDQQSQLDLLLTALELQSVGPDAFEVVVADDGSPARAVLGDRPYATRAVRQENLGFRASAARDLGARATDAEVICFLDCDTVPEPDYLRTMTDVIRQGDKRCGVVAVGRRRHADLTGWEPARLRAWLRGDGAPPTPLTEPAWLREGYRATDNLRYADDRSYRFVISAVLGMTRRTYLRSGGFDPGFVGYGGEDWDLANRCWLSGCDLRHVPDAVAWHDGPDFADRSTEHTAVKDRETLQLARVLTDPMARGSGFMWPYPATVVRVHGHHDIGPLAASCSSWLAGGDVALWFVDRPRVPTQLPPDPRLHHGAPSNQVLQRCRYQVDVYAPLALSAPLPRLIPDGGLDVRIGTEIVARVRHTRMINRGAGNAPAAVVDGRLLDDSVTLESRWGGWDT
jgi:GT2 family glycosyltransferase